MTFIFFILLLSVVITVHEAGHLIAAKAFNVYCKEFSIGMGPLLYQKKFKETLYSIRLIPLGGYLAMAGESEENKDEDLNLPKERTLLGIAPIKRIVIQAAGIIMNLVLAILLIGSVFLMRGYYPVAPEPLVKDVEVGSPADLGGFKQGDYIIEIEFSDGLKTAPETMNDLSNFMAMYKEGEITFTVLRDGKEQVLKVTPEYSSESQMYLIGIYSDAYSIKETNIFNCWIFAIDYCMEMMRSLVVALTSIAKGSIDTLSGPIAMYEVTGEIVQLGFLPYLLLLGVISLNVGFMNAIPVPILDGGRILLTFVEMIIRRPIPKRLENALMGIGVFIMLGLMLLVTFNDLLKVL